MPIIASFPVIEFTQDDADARYLKLAGGSVTGNIAMSNHKITGLSSPSSGTDATNKSYVDSLKPSAYPISIPTTGWVENMQTFTVTGIPSDPTTYEVHLSQVGETNVIAAMTCGIYIVDEGANSLTLAVSEIPTTAFQVYAVVESIVS